MLQCRNECVEHWGKIKIAQYFRGVNHKADLL